MNINFFLMIVVCFVASLQCMDNAMIMDDQTLAWNIIVRHGAQWFDYKTINSLSKKHEALAPCIAEYNKEYFMQQKPHRKLIKDLVWNKEGTVCGKVSFGKHPDWVLTPDKRPYEWWCEGFEHELMIEQCSAYGNYNRYTVYDGFHCCLPHRPREIIKSDGSIYFYGCGKIDGEQTEKAVIEYGFSYCPPWQCECVTNIKGIAFPLKLIMFLEFPALLKAFLESSIQVKMELEGGHVVKVYGFEGVTIPENYRDHKHYFSTLRYKSFKELPKVIRKAIVARYNAQHKKKTKKKR